MAKPNYFLLIDDDHEDKDFFNIALRNVSAEDILHYCASGIDAIKNLKNGNYKPDYIFLDLNMMPINGIETLTEIKKIPGCTNIPVIIYSTTIDDEVISKTHQLGAFGCFQKPYTFKDLEIYLKQILNLSF